MTFGWVDCRKRRQLAIRQYSNKYYVVQDVPEGSVEARR